MRVKSYNKQKDYHVLRGRGCCRGTTRSPDSPDSPNLAPGEPPARTHTHRQLQRVRSDVAAIARSNLRHHRPELRGISEDAPPPPEASDALNHPCGAGERPWMTGSPPPAPEIPVGHDVSQPHAAQPRDLRTDPSHAVPHRTVSLQGSSGRRGKFLPAGIEPALTRLIRPPL